MKAAYTIIVAVTALSPTLARANHALEVCELLRSAKHFDGRAVLVTGEVQGDALELRLLVGRACSQGIALQYEDNAVPADFESAVERRVLRLDARPLKACVRGRFKYRIKGRLGYLSAIDVTSVIGWYVGGEDDGKPSCSTNPSPRR